MATLAQKIAAQNAAKRPTGLLDTLRFAGKVINEGLLNPNKFNAPSANRFKDSALGLLGGVPGVGDVASGAQAADYLNRGDKLNAGLAALGALPVIPNMAGIFIGKGAKTWDALNAAEAEKLFAGGANPKDVWKQTGTMRGADKELMQEISDNTMTMNLPMQDMASGTPSWMAEMGDMPAGPGNQIGMGPLGNIATHPNLYSAYPDIKNIQSEITQGNLPESGVMSFNSGGFPVSLTAAGPDARSPALHEIQHAIQKQEGWQAGGNPSEMRQTLGGGQFTGLYSPEELYGAYRRLSGEVLARLTQARLNMTMPQRLAAYPGDMMDVPMEQQIGLLGLGGKRNK